jgi:hypothetical protein
MLKFANNVRRGNWFPALICLLGFILFFPLFSCSAHSDPSRVLTIVYANRINGQLDPCG